MAGEVSFISVQGKDHRLEAFKAAAERVHEDDRLFPYDVRQSGLTGIDGQKIGPVIIDTEARVSEDEAKRQVAAIWKAAGSPRVKVILQYSDVEHGSEVVKLSELQ